MRVSSPVKGVSSERPDRIPAHAEHYYGRVSVSYSPRFAFQKGI
jgi:hypothetical protein